MTSAGSASARAAEPESGDDDDECREQRPTTLLAAIGEPFSTLLRAALEVLAVAQPELARPEANNDPERLRSVVDLMARSQPLRLLAAKKFDLHALAAVSVEADMSVARALLSSGEDAATEAAEHLGGVITSATAAARSERRQQRRTPKASPEEKAEERARERLNRVRAARDRALAQVHRLESDKATNESRLESLQETLLDTDQRLDAVRAQVNQLRARTGDVAYLAGLLADALDSAGTHAGHPAGSLHEDPFDALDTPETQDSLAALLLLATNRSADSISDSAVNVRAEVTTGESVARRSLRRLLRGLASPPIRTLDLGLRVDVLGAGAEIGGSCVLVEAAGTRLLVDCGNRPRGTTRESTRPPGYERALTGKIDAVVITHAHNDHAGWVPALLKDRPEVRIYATPATCDLLVTMWADSAKVMERNGLRAYDQNDVNRAVAAFQETPFRHAFRVGELDVELFRAGHIVGAASVTVAAGPERVVISGDVSAAGQESVGGFQPTATALGSNLLLLESTYAGDDRNRVPRGNVVKDFIRTVEATVDRGGIALVPAFALGRAQEVALLCARLMPHVPVMIDGLARSVTEVYERHPGPDGSIRRIFSETVQRVPQGGTDLAARRFSGGVVITTSGMLTQGPAVRWAERVLPDPKSSLMVVGYQDEESPGARLLNLADRGGGWFELPVRAGEPEKQVEVNATVARYQLGAHANADELAQIVSQMQPKQLMLVHGEARNQAQFTNRMSVRAQSSIAPGAWRAGK